MHFNSTQHFNSSILIFPINILIYCKYFYYYLKQSLY